MRRGKGYLVLGLVVVGLLVAAVGAQSFSSGVTRPLGLTEQGCICHGEGGQVASAGVRNANVSVMLVFDPDEGSYAPGKAYTITVGPAETDVEASQAEDENKGGFNLMVTGGTLAAAEGFEDFVMIAGNEATHTAAGDKNGRVYNLTWTAPESDVGLVSFKLFVNTVNGDGAENAEDHWSGAVFGLPGPSGELVGAGGETNPSKIGVNWLAHWVGVISMVAVVGSLVIYYFVLKYGESMHTTDHRDRKD